jgi:flavin-dependent dehydrogenase
MKRVAILGGGPAGAFAGERLAAAGFDVALFDDKLAWEKPCGGGLTHKAYSRYPFLIDNPTPKRFVREAVLGATGAGNAALRLSDPLLIYSRLDLNRMLLQRAEAAGAQLEKVRVSEITRYGSGWQLRTKSGIAEADYCVVATGARNGFAEVGARFKPGDTMIALGYYIDGDQSSIDIQFMPGLEGYIWVFPRCGHLSAGICGKGQPAAALRKRLEDYLHERGLSWKGAQFYSHVLPALAPGSWRNNRVAGDGWVAVGDAAGLVDPVTGEGLYYAVRSADLAAAAIISEESGVAERLAQFGQVLWQDFASELEYGSSLARRLFVGQFLMRPTTMRMVQFMRGSPRFSGILQDLFAGRLPYTRLKRRLLQNLNGSLYDVGMSFGFSRLTPRKAD